MTHTYIHSYITHTYIHSYRCKVDTVDIYFHTHTHTHTYTHTHTHTYIHTYMYRCKWRRWRCSEMCQGLKQLRCKGLTSPHPPRAPRLRKFPCMCVLVTEYVWRCVCVYFSEWECVLCMCMCCVCVRVSACVCVCYAYVCVCVATSTAAHHLCSFFCSG